MGQHGTRQEELLQLEGIPLVKNRYLPLSLLGGGAFGRVFKVEDVRSKCLYALKVVPFTPYRGGVSRSQIRTIIKSAETESTLLRALDHPNVVRLVDTFVLDRSPVHSFNSQKPLRSHLCILLEYIHGSDLNELLKKQESESSLTFPQDICLHWFIEILKTMVYVHSENIIHRDLKPDNILIGYESLTDLKSMIVKLTDFGVGKNIEGGQLGRTVSGQLFYSAPEVLAMSMDEGYDSRCDMWSLGLIFLQVYAGISIGTYQEAVGELFDEIRRKRELREGFASRYGEEALEGTTAQQLLPLLSYLHENDLFHIVTDSFVSDPGVRKVIDVMICPYERRLKAPAVCNLPVVKTWQFLLDRTGNTRVEEFDMDAVITVLKIEDNPILLKKCFEVLISVIGRDVKYVNDFVSGGGVGLLFGRVGKMKDLWKQKWLEQIISVIVRIVGVYRKIQSDGDSRVEFLCKKVAGFLRQFDCVDLFKKLFEQKNQPEIYYFTYLVTLHSGSLCTILADLARPALLKMNRGNAVYMQAILRNLVVFMPAKAVMHLLQLYNGDIVHFCARCRRKTFGMRKEVIRRILRRIGNRKARPAPREEAARKASLKKLQQDLFAMMYMIRDQYQADELKKHRFTLQFPQGRIVAKNSNLKVALKTGQSRAAKNGKKVSLKRKDFVDVGREQGTGLRTFRCVSDDTHVFVALVSSDPLCPFTLTPGAEHAIAYFEVDVKDGGLTEDMFIGFKANRNQLLLHCLTGTIGIWDGTTNVEDHVPGFPCDAGSFVGAGITNRGTVFFAKNNEFLLPQANHQFLKQDDLGAPVYPYVKFRGNKFLFASMNFGKVPFRYQFGSVQPPIAGASREGHGVRGNGVCEDTALEVKSELDPQLKLMKVVLAGQDHNTIGYRLGNRLLSLLDPRAQFSESDSLSDAFLSSYFHEGNKLRESVVTKAFAAFMAAERSQIGRGARSSIVARYSQMQDSLRRRKDLGDLHVEQLKRKKKRGFLNSRREDGDVMAGLPDHVAQMMMAEQYSDSDEDEDETVVRNAPADSRPRRGKKNFNLSISDEPIISRSEDREVRRNQPSEESQAQREAIAQRVRQSERARRRLPDASQSLAPMARHRQREVLHDAPLPDASRSLAALSRLKEATSRPRRSSISRTLRPGRSRFEALFEFGQRELELDEDEEEGEV